MKYAIEGIGADGMLINLVMDFADEAAVRAYADSNGIRLTSIAPLADQSAAVNVDNQPRGLPTECNRLKSNETICYFCGGFGLVASILMLLQFPMIFPAVMIAFSFFLLSVGASYRIGATVLAEVAGKNS